MDNKEFVEQVILNFIRSAGNKLTNEPSYLIKSSINNVVEVRDNRS